MPTRLLSVGATGGKYTVKLINSAELHEVSQYAALSHCWGNTQHTRLRWDNINAFHEAIEWSALSKTFRHAIDLTIRLGLRYLWIDALCIIQDDVGGADWANEAAQMGAVYAHALVCFAASVSQNADEGLYRRRDLVALQSCIIPAKRGSSGGFSIARAGQWTSVEDATLAKRGWVVQERFLAPRTLHFVETQVLWECQTSLSSECLQPTLCLVDGHHFSDKDKLRSRLMNTSALSDHENPILKVWHNLVGNYLTKSLTFPSDKPVAIAGLARMFTHFLSLPSYEECYLNGLWRPWLNREVMWLSIGSPGTDPNAFPHPPEWPSWTWLSLNNVRIEWMDLCDSSARFIGTDMISIKPESSDLCMIGLVVQAQLCEIELTYTSSEPSMRSLSYHLDSWSIIFDGELKHDKATKGVCLYPDGVSGLDWLYVGPKCYRKCYLMHGLADRSTTQHAFLVLRRDVRTGCFQRVGLLEWRMVKTSIFEDRALYEDVIMQRFRDHRLPDGICDGPDTRGFYTFTMI